MEQNRSTLEPLDSPGQVTTVYAYEGGPVRNGLLAAMALQLAGDAGAAPVLAIDWDLASPSLHGYFGPSPGADTDAGPPGLVDYAGALLAELRRRRIGRDDGGDGVADALLDAVDWRPYVQRVDGRRPLYLMRAGRFDDDYAERAGSLDWAALFDACPALLRRFSARLAGHFRHVLVAGGAGRSASVSACTVLVPDRLVGLFTPAPGSIDGLEGVVRRAIDYRCTHEDEQRPLLVYPVACAADGARSDSGQRWRRGDPAQGLAGYQPRLEALLRASYGVDWLRLESWFDEVQVPVSEAVAIAGPGRAALAHPASCLMAWFAQGCFPWQPLAEVRLRDALARARAHEGKDAAVQQAGCLARLAGLCRDEGRANEARELLRECLLLRCAVLGDEHPDTRAAHAALAALDLAGGRLDDARQRYELLAQLCARFLGADHPETLAARSGLACVLGQKREGERALALHEQVVATCERLWGDAHPATLDSLEQLALTLDGQRENDRARVLFERVLEGRRQLQGAEHEDTLRCGQRLARLLGEMGDLGNARRLLEAVLRVRERYDGAYAAPTLSAREALARILAAQGDMAAVRNLRSAAAPRRETGPGAGHADEPQAIDCLQQQCAQLKALIDQDSRLEARALADSMRHSVQWLSVALPLRQRVAAMIEQVYLREGDKDAALALNKDLVSSLEGALVRARREESPVLR
ncbi:tetratricopeptide repeat protein [Massilia sp.]|uniref:tetratricopeptide repeat protein n=1 Tax=Massilia sp. TaxID=1882437 RepID=UPI00391CFF16